MNAHRDQDVQETREVTAAAPSAFQSWFGASRIVGNDDQPLPVYHGTSHRFTAFDPEKSAIGSFGRGFYFTDARDVAAEYAEDHNGAPGHVMEVYLSVQNPYIYYPSEESLDGAIGEELVRALLSEEDADRVIAGMVARDDESFGDEVMKELQTLGYDGIVVVYPSGQSGIKGMQGSTDIVVFSPTQIKSATENNGQFDAEHPDIRFDRMQSEMQPQRYLTDRERTARYQALFTEVRATPEWIELNRKYDEAAAAYTQYWKDVEAEALRRFRERIAASAEATQTFAEYTDRDLRLLANQLYLADVRKSVPDMAAAYAQAEQAIKKFEFDYVESRMPPENPFAEAANQRRAVEHTQAFKDWFEGSKAVNADGRPLIAFHGTTKDFTEFKTADAERLKGGKRGGNPSNPNHGGALGSWFAAPALSGYDDAGNAEATAHQFMGSYSFDVYQDGANVRPVYLSIKNPMEFAGFEHFQDVRDEFSSLEAFKQHMLDAGHDGFVIRDSDTDGGMFRDDWVAFYPQQIKSALGNNGQFNADNPDIRFDAAGFDAWIDGTAVTDDAGLPLVLYHGTNSSFDVFDFDRSREDETIFAAKTPRVAGEFALYRSTWFGANVMPIYVKANRILEVQGNGRPIRQVESDFWVEGLEIGEGLRDYARRMGYDGIVYRDVRDDVGPDITPLDDIYAFFPTAQIKSAIGNNGQYDANNPDIRYDRATASAGNQAFQLIERDRMSPELRQQIEQLEAAGGNKFQVEAAAMLDDAIDPKRQERFDAWFGRSQVTENGQPLVVWRGENDGHLFTVFDRAKTNEGVGFFFAVEKEQADGYAGNGTAARSFYLKAERLLDLTDPYRPANRDFLVAYSRLFDSWVDRSSGEETTPWDLLEAGALYAYEGTGSGTRWKALFEFAEDMGYDGVKVLDSTDGVPTSPIFVVFDPRQIKSTENAGQFDPENPDIRFDAGLGRPLTREERFGKWFKQSVVTNPDGRPRAVYHGTKADFSVFRKTYTGEFGPAMYFTDSPREASEYGNGKGWGGPAGTHVMPVFLSIQNPYTKGADEFWKEFGREGEPDAAAIDRAKAAGYDGIVAERPNRYYDNELHEYVDRGDMLTHYIVFDETQIKSAIGNNGDFSPENPDIRFDRGLAPSDVTKNPAFLKWFDGSQVTRNGHPLPMYHGTQQDFNIFDYGKIKSINEGVGFYFSDNAAVAGGYGKLKPVYLSIKKPLPYGAGPFGKSDLRKIVLRIAEIEAAQTEMGIGDGFLSNFGDVSSEGLERVLRVATDSLANDVTANDQIAGIFHSGVSPDVVLKAVHDVAGYDGIVADGFSDSGEGDNRIYVAWFREQIKSAVDNNGEFNPENPDIRFDRAGFADVQPDMFPEEFLSPAASGNQNSEAKPVAFTGQGLANFNAWHDGSKAVDDDGRPLVLYHGTRADFTQFEAGRETKNTSTLGFTWDTRRAGIFMTPNRDFALSYAGKEEGSNVMPVYAAISNPLDLTKYGVSEALYNGLQSRGYNPRMLYSSGLQTWELFDHDNGGDEFVAALKDMGYDGAIIYEDDDDRVAQKVFVAFDPEQIKSAIGNNGQFSAENPDIRFDQGGQQPAAVREDGTPLRLYHGSKSDISVFVPSNGGEFGPGIYLTDDPNTAWKYAGWAKGEAGENISPVYASIKNPYYVTKQEWLSMNATQSPRAIQKRIKAKGHDGIIATGLNGHEKQYVVFEPNQVKSAIGNASTFDKESADIRYKRPQPAELEAAVGSHKTLQLLAQFFKADVGVVRLNQDAKLKFNGVNFEDKIWLNQASKRPLHVVFGHELLHQMRKDRPELYAELYDVLRPMLKNEEVFARQSTLVGKSADYVHEEMVADLFGERFGEAAFWQKVAEKKPGLFGQIAAYMQTALYQVTRFLKKNDGESQFVSDLEAAREAIANTVVDYAEHLRQQEMPPPDTEPGEDQLLGHRP